MTIRWPRRAASIPLLALAAASAILLAPAPSRSADPPLPNAYAINPSICLALSRNLGCLYGTSRETLSFWRFEARAAVDRNVNDIVTREEVSFFDRGLNQLHQVDGGLIVVVFVDDDANVTFSTDKGLLRVQAGNDVATFTCNGAPVFPFTDRMTHDEDCDNDGTAGDGFVFAQLLGANAALGPGTLTVTRAGTTETIATIPFTVVGEAASISVEVFESKIQEGLLPSECNSSPEPDYASAVAHPSKTIAIARVKDAAGTDITGAWVSWEQEFTDKVRLFPQTPSMALGPYGTGAATFLCGLAGTGVVSIDLDLIPGPLGLSAFDPAHGTATASTQIEVVGAPVSLELTPASPELLCDGVATTTIGATLRDANGTTVADGVSVTYTVPSIGIADPVTALTIDGTATTTVRGLSAFTVGLPIIAAAGGLEESTLLTCLGFDTDADGMPNTFESAHACLNASLHDADGDPDTDGATSLAEYAGGSQPCNPNTDGDACLDGLEFGAFPELGGDRNPSDFWDFYDVTGDGTIDLSDTLFLLGRFAEGPGSPGYDPLLDRYAPDPAKPWRTAPSLAPLGIDITDALVNLNSFGHGCASNPDD